PGAPQCGIWREVKGSRVLVGEIEGDVVQGYAAYRVEIYGRQIHGEKQASLPEGLNPLAEDGAARADLANWSAALEPEGHGTGSGADRDTPHRCRDGAGQESDQVIGALHGRADVVVAMPGGGVHAGIEAERLAAVAERKQVWDQAAEPTIALGLER